MSSRSLTRQRGAVTLIGAMFLIVSVSILLTAVQRKAGSSITDSALYSDGIQALFIAESGLERAAWRYDRGDACTALAGESGNIGPGNFTVLSGSMVATGCRIRVIGTVTTTTAVNKVTRTIEGELSGSAAGAAAGSWAVGNRDPFELIINFDGNSWNRAGPYADIPEQNLWGISCITANDCWAVGSDSGGELIIHWNGTDWSRAGPYSANKVKRHVGHG